MSRPLVLRAGPFSVRTTRRMLVVCALLCLVVVALAAWAMMLGSYRVSIGEVIAALSGGAEPAVHKVVMEWRAPRVGAAVLFGAALGVAGAVFQSLTHNPLGSPDVIGFTTGSFTGVVVAMLLGGTGYAALSGGALIGGLLTAAAVYLLAFRQGLQGFRLIIVGIAVGAFLGAMNSWFMVKADVDLALRAAVWGAGSLSVVDGDTLAAAAIVLTMVALALPAAARRMRRLELGDDAAAMLGVPVERTKALLVLLGVAATAAVTAAAGPIAFIALAAPQIARRLTGHGASADLAGSALTGAVLLLSADIVAQHALPGLPLPTGAVTVCIGGAYLLVLLARESRRLGREGRS
ncbi:iron chelate uptake ABC transporter family permease subunit [Microbacterium sp. KUDC0406]|uniref:FecCD family ABC transporter permease n=1 Tax=Microbacterium sp. KUDC0406 TaxID=2909588 RepID=UPI001F1A44CC|nr:iron chelate uptake ABC transporter family permease subunit [Microbacterium sp. KUDC0406]UJP09294.1 iron chelate uptake ABC transporter family permease subunit [Microbacterium sp. KUDC0406]